MKTWKLVLGASLAMFVVSGCAVESTETDETTGTTEDAVTYAKLEGTWTGEDGIIYSLTLTKDRASTLGGFLKGYAFTATIDTGARCIVAPCDVATAEVSGVYKVVGTTLTLASYDKPTAAFGRILGDYHLATAGGVTKITLTKSDGTLTEHFHKETTVGGAKCGKVTCGAGQYCCNPLTSICVKMGMMCTL